MKGRAREGIPLSPRKVLLSWSSGKDSAWALHVLRQRSVDVVGLLSTVREGSERVTIHDVSPALLAEQAAKTGLPLTTLAIPDPCPNAIYERIMSAAMAAARAQGITHVAFGDLFLEDIRAYRESKLASTGIAPLFPLFGADTRTLAKDMISAGLDAVLVTTDPRKLDPSLCGRRFAEVVPLLPADVDPCGENGEFHTFAFAGPMFSGPIDVSIGPVTRRAGFDHVDLQRR